MTCIICDAIIPTGKAMVVGGLCANCAPVHIRRRALITIRNQEKTMRDNPSPDVQDLIRELRDNLGLFHGSMSISPREAWQDALNHMHRQLIKAEKWDRFALLISTIIEDKNLT